jgi:hypothetical protein
MGHHQAILEACFSLVHCITLLYLHLYYNHYTARRDHLFSVNRYHEWLMAMLGSSYSPKWVFFFYSPLGVVCFFLRSWAPDIIACLSGCILISTDDSRLSRLGGVFVCGWCWTPGMCYVWVPAWSVILLIFVLSHICVLRKQYTKCCLCSTFSRRASSARNM